MKLGSFDTLVRALDGAGVRYLVRDVDVVLQLSPKNIAAAS